MKLTNFSIFISLVVLIPFISCTKQKSAIEIVDSTIQSIDDIETIYYKQDMSRTNPRNINDTISRYREMYFERLVSDSIVGVKGHWYMYVDDRENVIYEDIYDGNRLIRKNNRDSVARIYDLLKYPVFKKKHFWSHNTLYGMQYEFRHILDNPDSYTLQRLNDTLIESRDCYHLQVILEDCSSMPGFATKLEDSEGSISETSYFIAKDLNYPIRIKGESYLRENADQKYFIEQDYYDIEINVEIDAAQFNTDLRSLEGYEIVEMKPE